MTVRTARPSDAEAIRDILAQAFEPYREAYTPEAYRHTVLDAKGVEERMARMEHLVAEDAAGRIVGTVAWTIRTESEAHLRGMAVLPGEQGRGIGARLLGVAERRARREGCARMTLGTTRVLRPAIAFYQRRGYAMAGGPTSFFGMELLEMEKPL